MGVLLAVLAATIGIGSLLIGTAIAWLWDVPKKVVAAVLALGAGVLIATLALALVDEAETSSGPWLVAVAFGAGAALYVGADAGVTRLSQNIRSTKTKSAAATSQLSVEGTPKAGSRPLRRVRCWTGSPRRL